MRKLKLKTAPSKINSRATFTEAPGSELRIQLSVEVTEQRTDTWKGIVRTSTIQGTGGFTLGQEVTMTRMNGDIFQVQ